MEFTLGQIAEAIGAYYAGDANQRVTGWSIDSRTVSPGDLFFAIKGDLHDGHAFVADVLARGAVAAVVSEDSLGSVLRVRDTIDALQAAARFARSQWSGTVVAVTGSAGKTSTKDIIAELLSVGYFVGKTTGNLNNHLGLPLSILRLPGESTVAVLEMGMNHAGEIRALAQIAKPQIGVVTNVGYAHVEAFESIEGVAAAKRELVEELPTTGIAVLNADDERVRHFEHRCRSISYGLSTGADVRAEDVAGTAEGTAFKVRGLQFRTRLSGEHSVRNILAGLAVADALGLSLHSLIAVVAALRPGKMRGERLTGRGLTLLNDSYNSNPEAARSMVGVLQCEQARRKIAVLGEMRELGAMSEQLHRGVGRSVAEAQIDVLVGICGASRFMVDEAVKRGLDARAAFFFEDPESAGDFLRGFVREGDALLFKGSRGTHVEKALARIEI